MKRLILSFLLMLGAVTWCMASTVTKADSAYSANDFKLAAELYQNSINEGGPSSTKYYNLGNAYYRMGQTGRAVINYERALNMDPSNERARDNLNFVNSQLRDKPADSSTFLGNLHRGVVSLFSPNTWSVIAICAFVVMLVLTGIYLMNTDVVLRKVGFFGGIVWLLITVYIIVVAANSSGYLKGKQEAVIIVPVAYLNSSPDADANNTDKVLPLHEGTKVLITDSLSTPGKEVSRWYEVKVNGTSTAWVNAAEVEKI
ncbi:MAG: tetratricopeptide repeat protein [Muribaculaceae bacterium]|nr:tetratricopeptide repeat protein [Muribaculaceae bacterium]